MKVDCWLLNLIDKTWTYTLPLSTACHNHSSVKIDQCALGRKCAGMKVMESVECLDIIQHLWLSVPGMPQSVSNPFGLQLWSQDLFIQRV